MMWLIKLLQKKPKDKTIRISRVIFGLILSGSLYYNLIMQGDSLETNFFWSEISSSSLEYIKYGFIGLGLMPIIMGITNICLLKKKYMRYLQVLFGIILFYISGKIVPLDANKLDVDSLIAFMGILPLLAGITGKCITTGCMKFKEKITKIRV